jgi:hypothetical protein
VEFEELKEKVKTDTKSQNVEHPKKPLN